VKDDGLDCYHGTKGPACLTLFHGAGHAGFTDIGDEVRFPDERLWAVARTRIAAFFGLHLAGRASCAAVLADPGDAAGGTADGTWVGRCRQ